MKKNKILFVTLLSMLSLNVLADKEEQKVQKVGLDTSICNAQLAFKNEAITKKQTLKVSNNIKLNLEQRLSTFSQKGAEIATNVTCQKLVGANYTGSENEWASFIQNATSGMQKSKAHDIQLLLTGDKARVYDDIENSKEYDFKATFGSNRQLIKNLAVLDKSRNTVYTLSVSGAIRAEKEVIKEFNRLVGSFKLQNTKP